MDLDRILTPAASGRRVVVIDARRASLRTTFEDLVAPALAAGATVYRTSGQERILFAGGGRIQFIHPGLGGCRGVAADVVHVHGWDSLTQRQREDIMPMLNASPSGELIRA